jgi:hypothetical protein
VKEFLCVVFVLYISLFSKIKFYTNFIFQVDVSQTKVKNDFCGIENAVGEKPPKNE